MYLLRKQVCLKIYQMNHFEARKIGKPQQWLIEAAAEIGLDFSGLTHEITNHFMTHVINRHGKGLLAITEKDFDKIPGIVETPDLAIIGVYREKALINAYAKREEGATYLYFEEVLDSKRNKALRGRTFYKIIKPIDLENFERIITMNKITDLTGGKKIAAGGHPGGEA
jgi:hypothetical protein